MAEHLRDPLDYLYEELPPEGMAEAKAHLAACPACRAEMRAVRETVRRYRRAPKPAAPDGLAARAARTALEEAARERKSAAPVPEQPAPPVAPPAPVPATAPVPRTASAPPPVPLAASLESAIRASSVRFGRPGAAVDIDAEFARLKDEVLKEIPRGWRTWLFHPAWTVAAAVIFVCALCIHFSPRMRQTETRFLPSLPQRDESSSLQIRDRERLPASRPRAASDGVAAVSGPAPILQEAAAMNEIVELPPFAATARSAAATPRIAAAAPVPAQASVPVPVQAETAAGSAAAPMAAVPAEGGPPPPAGGDAAAAGQAEAAPSLPPPSPADPIPPEMLDVLGKKAAAAADAAPVVIMAQPDADQAPQLIERPRAYDAAERIRTLTALAGMQMAEGEFDDARTTVRLLDAYDADAARSLSRTLGELEKAAREQAKAEAEKKAEEERKKEEESKARESGALRPPPSSPGAMRETPPTESQPVAEAPPAAAASPLPDHAPYLETAEPPEDPPMSTVRVPRADMAYTRTGVPPVPVFSPVLVPEAVAGDVFRADDPAGIEPEEIAAVLDSSVSEPVDEAENGAGDAEESIAEDGDRSATTPARRPAGRESVYVDTPVGAGAGRSAGPGIPPSGPLTVYVPVVPVIPVAPRAVETPERRRPRPFTTDPYFRDY